MEQVVKFLLDNCTGLVIVLILIGVMTWLIVKEINKRTELIKHKQDIVNQHIEDIITHSISDLAY